MDLKEYEFRNQPWFDIDTFETFQQAIPMKTLVIHCFDPRASEIPRAVAEYLGDEVYPGENIVDEAGNRIGHTRTLFTYVNGGGRAAQALEGIAMMEYLFRVQNVAVVHHSFCGLTSMTPDHIVDFFQGHHHADLGEFDRASWTIPDYNESIAYDLALLRSSPAVPKHVNLYGFFYEISSGKLVELGRDIPADASAP